MPFKSLARYVYIQNAIVCVWPWGGKKGGTVTFALDILCNCNGCVLVAGKSGAGERTW